MQLVPLPNGSLVVLNLQVKKLKTSIADLNSIMKKYALEGELVEQIKYSTNNELVSSDIVGTSAPSIYVMLLLLPMVVKNIVLHLV
jgi:glyceraldehyde 3-phosphate dehydrogenase